MIVGRRHRTYALASIIAQVILQPNICYSFCSVCPTNAVTKLTPSSRFRGQNAFSYHVATTSLHQVKAVPVRFSDLSGDETAAAKASVAASRPTTTSLAASTTLSPSFVANNDAHNEVPATWNEAWRVFFLKHAGPPLVVAIWTIMATWRVHLTMNQVSYALAWTDLAMFVSAVLFWWIQEHFIHQKLLHSSFDWIGKRIHLQHHNDKPYHHVSIEPAPLILSWLGVSHLFLRLVLPLPLALSASMGYILAGFGYMVWHYLVHTRVRFHKNSYPAKIQAHHARHHQVDDRYWLGFSMLLVDDLFGTNPSIKQVREWQKGARQTNND